jgi:60 kDa SS-A/Ro ribonucleoprotein
VVHDKEPDALAYQLVKYRQRGGWTHGDLLRLSHPKVDAASKHNDLFAWVLGGESPDVSIIEAYRRAQIAETPAETVAVLREYPDLPREALNPDHLTSPDVWDALLRSDMPMTALMRNLATMSRVGLLTPMSEAAASSATSSGRRAAAQVARPPARGARGAQDLRAGLQRPQRPAVGHRRPRSSMRSTAAFYAAFGNVQVTGKRTMLALDVSGSMSWAADRRDARHHAACRIGGNGAHHCRDRAAACVTAFSHTFVHVELSRACASTT